MGYSLPDRCVGNGPAIKQGILEIAPYVGGKSEAVGFERPIKLSSNENALGCSGAAKQAYLGAVSGLHTYPDGRAGQLRDAIAHRYGLEPDRLVFGCGTDELIGLLNQILLERGDNIVQGEYGFASYAIAARACQGDVRYAAERDFVVSVDEILHQIDERTRIVFLANPANPSGTFLPAAEVKRLHSALPCSVVLVLDGAYAEFVTIPDYNPGFELARTAANVVVSHTFSKIHGLAGLRVGWAYCPPLIANAIERIRHPFNISMPAQAAAIAALEDTAFQQRSVEFVDRWRSWLTQQLSALGLIVTPSAANFVLVHFPPQVTRTAQQAESYLASRGILVRGVANYGLPNALRISIGLESHNRLLVDVLSEFLTSTR